ncbi:hemicentin-1 [Agrilus planipennis]|uniref:Hemicentin-1 n=1 Tax=Agrilus planipennis TaxID=224129 RepID=A0A1W4W3B8_AGRPL|nr:hemicentin-1 [Agrilus planipennis]
MFFLCRKCNSGFYLCAGYRCILLLLQYLFGFLAFLSYRCCALDSEGFQKNLPAKVVWGVVGKDVELPCDLTTPTPKDTINMVFWFKDSAGVPLYSILARGSPLDKSSHLSTTDDLGSRSTFITDGEPSRARLRIRNVKEKDEGTFRCRVDFSNSPTRNFKINLTLVVQPSPPQIFDSKGREVVDEAGPFLEGQELFLSCQVTGGRPPPSLTWWHNGTILDSVVDTSRESFTTVNQLTISKVERSLRGNKLECKATSAEIAGTLNKDVRLVVYLRPSKVKIVTPNALMSVNKAHTVKCETSGSYPPAKLTWLLNDRLITNTDITEEKTESFTNSILTLNVKAEDDGQDLVCRADNPRFPGGSVEDRRQIQVAYPPKVAVHPGSGPMSHAKEGLNVTLHCDTKARPSPHAYSWYHDERFIQSNESAGILPLGNTYRPFVSLLLLNLLLFVSDAPRCKKGFEVMRVGVSYQHGTIIVDCHVEAIPDVTRFWWTYNTSKGVLPVSMQDSSSHIHNNDGTSTLHFSPENIHDVRSLACWASNSVGRQSNPCIFYIVPANRPMPPRNCVLRNTSWHTAEVSCTANEDGGLPQTFVLEVRNSPEYSEPTSVTTLSDQGENSPPLFRVLGQSPVFSLHSLEPDKKYNILVYAENAVGKSDPPVFIPNVQIQQYYSNNRT